MLKLPAKFCIIFIEFTSDLKYLSSMETETLNAWKGLQSQLNAYVNKKVKDKALAADLMQDVFLKVQANISQLKDTEKLPSWIFRITQHVVMDHFRKSTPDIAAEDLDWGSSQHEFNECVAQCLSLLMEKLPEKYRVALQLTDVDNLSQYALAERLNISYSGARSRVQRARKLLKEMIEALYLIKTDSYGNILVCENRFPCCCKREC